jgi:hypothetical protein
LTPTAGFDLLIRAALDQSKRTDVILRTCQELRASRSEMGVVEIGGALPTAHHHFEIPVPVAAVADLIT